MSEAQYKPARADIGDVIQLDPAHSSFGAIFAVVSELHGWGVLAYFEVPGREGTGFARVEHGHYARIGRAQWLSAEGLG